MERPTLEHRAATGAVLVFAFAWAWVCGNRGLFVLDQSIVLDGAWRIASGQVPFVDFTTPHGLTVMGLQSVLFRLFGPSYGVYVGLAALLNVLAAALSMVLVSRLLPGRDDLRLLAGALTGVWFSPVFGTPYSEQMAFVLSLCGLVAAIEACRATRSRRNALLFGAGVCAWLAFLSKQNAGVLFLPVYPAMIAALEGWRPKPLLRSIIAVAAGFLSGFAVFAGWLFAVSSPTRFWAAYFATPSGRLAERLDLFDLLTQPWFGAGRGPTKIVLMLWLIVAGTWTVRRFLRGAAKVGRNRAPLAAGVGVVALILFQNGFNLTTNNSGENAFAFTGIVTALTLGLAFPPGGTRPSRIGWFARAGAALLVSVLFVRGVEVGWSRIVHDSMARAEFSERIDRPGWGALRWPRELDIGHAVIPATDVQQLMGWLERDGRDFFVYPDFTWLYAAFERPSPQPVLWFHRGLTYPELYDPTYDDWIVRSLVERNIEIVVLERQSLIGPLDERLEDFPRLAAFLDDGFEEVARFGIFEVRVRIR